MYGIILCSIYNFPLIDLKVLEKKELFKYNFRQCVRVIAPNMASLGIQLEEP